MATTDTTTDVVRAILERDRAVNLIRGRLQESDGTQEERHDPATGQQIGVAAGSTEQEMDEAIDAAVEALPSWAGTPAPQRGDLLRRWGAAIEDHRESLARLMTMEMGKPLAESRGEVDRALAEIDYAAGEGTRLQGSTLPSVRTGVLVFTRPEPIGVVGAVTPWNFPLVAPVRKLAPALVCGTTVVLKPAQDTPFTALALGVLLQEAGLPEGVVNIVCGSGRSVGNRLVADTRVPAVSFTGSTQVGKQVGQVVGERLGSVQLELGGKNAAYVHSADDLDVVADEITKAAILATGQRCTAISRVIAEEELADELVTKLADRFDALQVGPGTDPDVDVGPLVNERQQKTVRDYIELGRSEGATSVTTERSGLPDGPYVSPVVLDGVTPDMRVAREEIFGPVLAVLRVTGVDAAIETANDCDYGLTSSVFSRDLDVALQFVDGVDAGMVHVNHGTNSEPHVPFGGVEASGAGPYSIGYTAKEFYTRLKVAYVKGRP